MISKKLCLNDTTRLDVFYFKFLYFIFETFQASIDLCYSTFFSILVNCLIWLNILLLYSSLNISHLIYIDDLLVIGKAEYASHMALHECLNLFHRSLGSWLVIIKENFAMLIWSPMLLHLLLSLISLIPISFSNICASFFLAQEFLWKIVFHLLKKINGDFLVGNTSFCLFFGRIKPIEATI